MNKLLFLSLFLKNVFLKYGMIVMFNIATFASAYAQKGNDTISIINISNPDAEPAKEVLDKTGNPVTPGKVLIQDSVNLKRPDDIKRVRINKKDCPVT